MTPLNFATVGLRLLAVYFFVQSVSVFTTFGVAHTFMFAGLEDPSGHPRGSAVVAALLPGASLLIAAILLYVCSIPMARRLAMVPVPESAERGWAFEQVQALGFALAGTLILVFALPNLPRGIGSVIELMRYESEGGSVDRFQFYDTWTYCFGVVAQVAVGLVPVLHPMGFKNAWHWLRTARAHEALPRQAPSNSPFDRR